MTFQLPANEARTDINYFGEKIEFVTEYSLVRVGTGKSVHLGSQNTYSDGKKSKLDTSCGADSGIHRSNSYKVNAPSPTCKRCLKKLDNMSN